MSLNTGELTEIAGIDSKTLVRSMIFAVIFVWAGAITISTFMNTLELNTRGFWIRESDEAIEVLLLENTHLKRELKAIQMEIGSLNE